MINWLTFHKHTNIHIGVWYNYLGDSKIQSISACVHVFVTFSYLANFSQTLLVDDIDI